MSTPYTPFPNQFRADLRAGKRLIGCWASLAAPITTEILGLAGFDWILLDGEHAQRRDHLRAAAHGAQRQSERSGGAAAVERARHHQAAPRYRLPQFSAALCRDGGAGPQRGRVDALSARWRPRRIGRAPQQHVRDRAGLLPRYQREHRRPVADREPPGAQYRRRNRGRRRRRRPVRRAFGPCSRLRPSRQCQSSRGSGRHPPDFHADARGGKGGRILAGVEDDARRYLDWGATFVAVGSDLGLFRAASQALCDRFKEPAPPALRAGLR